MRRVVITSVGIVAPIAHGFADFASALMSGRSGARRLAEVFPQFGHGAPIGIGAPVVTLPKRIPKRLHEERLHRSEVFAAGALQQLVDDCGSELLRDAPLLCGVGIGQLFPDCDDLHELDPQRWLELVPERLESPRTIVPSERGSAWFADHGTLRLARALQLRGPTSTYVSACAAGTQACIQACEEVRYGGADVAIGGAHDSLLNSAGIYMMHQLGTLTLNANPTTGIRPFDIDRDGTMLGEGAAYLVFEEREHARRRGATVLAEVAGYGSSLDGYHLTSPDPSGDGGVRMIEDALAMAELPPHRVDYVNAHGTSTLLNDVVEARIINRALQGHKPYVSATKPQIGHLIAACGAAELVACIAALRLQRVPSTLNLKHRDPECDLNLPMGDSRPAELEFALSNSFGFGGQNACMILRK